MKAFIGQFEKKKKSKIGQFEKKKKKSKISLEY